MREYVTEAVVLATRPRGEGDRVADLYTKELGRIEMRVVAAQRMLSKFTPHLDPGVFVTVRCVKKNAFTLTDILSDRKFLRTPPGATEKKNVLNVLYVVRALVPVLQPDAQLWEFLSAMAHTQTASIRMFLTCIGYDATFARCDVCKHQKVVAFYIPDQTFHCAECSRKPDSNALLYIEGPHT